VKIGHDIRGKKDPILIENKNTLLCFIPAEQDSLNIKQDITDEISSSLIEIHNNPLCTTTDISKLDFVETGLFHELFFLIIPDAMDILKIESIDIRFKDSMKKLYDKNSGKFQNDLL